MHIAYTVFHETGDTIFVVISQSTDFQNHFTVSFSSKFAVKRLLKIPSRLAYVATIPCETLMSKKQATNDALQGSVATYLRCGGVINKQH